MPVLEAKALHKHYELCSHTVNALVCVDFVVEEGEFVAIMGPSGSGKSTLLHLIGGLDKTSSGEIALAGQQLSLLKDKQITLLRRRNVGFVFQFFNLDKAERDLVRAKQLGLEPPTPNKEGN